MRKRTERRKEEREFQKEVRERIAMAQKVPGGAPTLPLRVTSAALVEPVALAEPCLVCAGAALLGEHEARVIDGRPLRVVSTKCRECGQKRVTYIEIAPPMLQ